MSDRYSGVDWKPAGGEPQSSQTCVGERNARCLAALQSRVARVKRVLVTRLDCVVQHAGCRDGIEHRHVELRAQHVRVARELGAVLTALMVFCSTFSGNRIRYIGTDFFIE